MGSRSRGRSLVRLLDMIALLRRRKFGVTREELAERFDVHVRTISRDLVVLKQVGFQLEGPKPGRSFQINQSRKYRIVYDPWR